MVTTVQRKTVEDLHAMPDDGRHYELINGVIVVSASPGEPHLWVSKRFIARLLPFELDVHRGWVFYAPAEVHLPTGDVVEPDLFFVSIEREFIRRRSHIEGVPDLVVEVVYPSSRRRDLFEKRAIYEASGVSEYWIADPAEKRLIVLVFRDGSYHQLPVRDGIVRSQVLPGFEMDVVALFANLP